MSRTLYFQQITDDRMDNNILELLKKRVGKLKELLTIEGVEIKVYNPILCTFTGRDWSPLKQDYIDKSYQYRSDFYVTKTSRKISWNDIYKLVNSIKAVPYKFI